jgi:hypothetical protein
MSPALFFFVLVLLGIVAGAAVVGSMVATIILVGLFLLASAGILSIGILVSFYKQSFTAGFKTVLMILCGLGGIAIGIGGFYAINRWLHLHYPLRTVLLSGVGGGLLGGLFVGFAAFAALKLILRLLKEKLAF